MRGRKRKKSKREGNKGREERESLKVRERRGGRETGIQR